MLWISEIFSKELTAVFYYSRSICKKKLDLGAFSSGSGKAGRYFKALVEFLRFEPANKRKKSRSRGRSGKNRGKNRGSDDENWDSDGGSGDSRGATLLNLSKLELNLRLKNQDGAMQGGLSGKDKDLVPIRDEIRRILNDKRGKLDFFKAFAKYDDPDENYGGYGDGYISERKFTDICKKTFFIDTDSSNSKRNRAFGKFKKKVSDGNGNVMINKLSFVLFNKAYDKRDYVKDRKGGDRQRVRLFFFFDVF